MSQFFADSFIDACTANGVDYFCIAPGWRSAPLILAVAEKQKDHFIHFDERALAFHALGYAAQEKKLACLITTSGSAVANLFPAIVEAYYHHIPLIVVTADRPFREKEWSGNQTIDQSKIFGRFAKWHIDLSAKDMSIAQINSSLCYGVNIAKKEKAAVHINCHIEEPMQKALNSFSFRKKPESSDAIDRSKKGVIVLGQIKKENLPPIYQLAKKLGWPIFADILSQTKTMDKIENQIDYFDILIKSHADFSFDSVLHFGQRVTCKKLFSFLRTTPSYIHIDEDPNLYDPYQCITEKIIAPISTVCSSLKICGKENKTWLHQWKREEKAAAKISKELSHQFPLSDSAFFSLLSEYFPAGSALFLGNSMPIRDADNFFHPINRPYAVMANRGTSGIDGNIATAAGYARGIQRHVVAVIGDLAALHDLNSFFQIYKADFPVTLIILNNQGGGIFSHMPAQNSPYLSSFFQCEHRFSFKKIAEAFSLPYGTIDDMQTFVSNSKKAVIEINTSIEQSLAFYQRFQEKLKAFHNNQGAVHV